jgi:hypothetical protein
LLLSGCAKEPEPLTHRQTEIQSLIKNGQPNEAISKAIELYDINFYGIQPRWGEDLSFGEEAKTRPIEGSGYEVVDGIIVGGEFEVLIGIEPFSSVDYLVSVLDHEAEHIAQWQEGRYASDSRSQQGIMNEVEAYDRILSRKVFLETSVKINGDNQKYRDSFYEKLTSINQARVDKKIYTIINE